MTNSYGIQLLACCGLLLGCCWPAAAGLPLLACRCWPAAAGLLLDRCWPATASYITPSILVVDCSRGTPPGS
jgi:hypothetical protein